MKTPQTEFDRNLDELQELLVRLKIEVDSAQLAADASWEANSGGACFAALKRAELLSREFSETAINAQIEATFCTE